MNPSDNASSTGSAMKNSPWPFRVVIGVIAFGVCMLLAKAAGLL
jgi:hypothetical protein